MACGCSIAALLIADLLIAVILKFIIHSHDSSGSLQASPGCAHFSVNHGTTAAQSLKCLCSLITMVMDVLPVAASLVLLLQAVKVAAPPGGASQIHFG